MNEMLVELKWRTLKIGYRVVAKYDALDEQEQEAVIDRIGMAVASLVAYPFAKRYYAKRGAPKWFLPAFWAVAIRLDLIERSLRRAERQAARNRKRRTL